jgi:CubicO group peptidase (beta-lactamase class C family)
MRRRDFLTQATAGVIGITAPAVARAQATVGRMRDTERFEQRVELIRRSLDIPGMSVAVLHKQDVILARGFGVVDLAKGTPASEHTPYPVASLTKTFAAAVIMRLVEEGKLDLDEPMSRYDPGFAQWCSEVKARSAPWARNYNCDSERITVRHHLTHTAQGKPGSAYQYNGSLFARLTAVIDALSPKGFIRAIEEDILNPLGMNDTALGAADPNKAGVIARMAKPYRLDPDLKVVESTTFTPPLDYISTASGIISTVMDLAKYDVAIDRDKVYRPQVKRQIWTATRSPAGQRFPYGLGWFVWEAFGRFYWHYGWYSDAFSSLHFKVPDRELTLILLACTDRASSIFGLGYGDPIRSAFVTAFLDSFGGRR